MTSETFPWPWRLADSVPFGGAKGKTSNHSVENGEFMNCFAQMRIDLFAAIELAVLLVLPRVYY